MLFFFFLSFIHPISFQRSNNNYDKQVKYSEIVDFSQFKPQIAIRIILYGFTSDNSFQKSFENILKRFLSSKKFGLSTSSNNNIDESYINVSLAFSVRSSKENVNFYENYINLVEKTEKIEDTEIEFINVSRDSEFTTLFSNLNAREIISASKSKEKLSTEKNTLIFVNHSKPIKFQYENSKELTDCLIFEFNSGFCQISRTIEDDNFDDEEYEDDKNDKNDKKKTFSNDDNYYLNKLFKYTSIFVEQIIIPDLLENGDRNFLITPSKVISPIVTFGPEVKSLSTLQKEVTSLFSPIESLLIVNRQNLYEFPLVATALQSKIGSSLLFTALGQSQHVFGSTLGNAIVKNDEKSRFFKEKIEEEENYKKRKNDYLNFTDAVSSINRQKVTPIYVFNSRKDKTNNLYLYLANNYDDNVDNNCISAIFADEREEAENVILASIAKIAGNINFLNSQYPHYQSFLMTSSSEFKRFKNDRSSSYCTFGGHHPFYPCGSSRSFSSIFSDAIIRNFALSNILVAFRNFIEIQNKLKKLDALKLAFINASLNCDDLNVLQKMIIRTSDRINNNEIAKALSSSSKAAEVSFKILNEADQLLIESSVFGNCCPETVYVSRPTNNLIVALIVVSFFGVVTFAFYKLYLLYKKKKITPKAFL